jgi:hypothetical protein
MINLERGKFPTKLIPPTVNYIAVSSQTITIQPPQTKSDIKRTFYTTAEVENEPTTTGSKTEPTLTGLETQSKGVWHLHHLPLGPPNLPTRGGECELKTENTATHQNRSGPPQINSTQTNGRRAQKRIAGKEDKTRWFDGGRRRRIVDSMKRHLPRFKWDTYFIFFFQLILELE